MPKPRYKTYYYSTKEKVVCRMARDANIFHKTPDVIINFISKYVHTFASVEDLQLYLTQVRKADGICNLFNFMHKKWVGFLAKRRLSTVILDFYVSGQIPYLKTGNKTFGKNKKQKHKVPRRKLCLLSQIRKFAKLIKKKYKTHINTQKHTHTQTKKEIFCFMVQRG